MKLAVIISAVIFLFVPLAASSATERVTVVRTPGDGAVPDAEVGRDGIVHVAYVSASDVFYVRSMDNGVTFSQPLRVNTRPGTAGVPAMYRGPDLALGPDGTVHVIWYADGYERKRPKNEWGVYYSRLVPGSMSFEPEQNLNHTPSDNYSVAASGAGDVAVFWMADGLFVNHSSDGGKTFGAAVKVPGAVTCECCASRALYGQDGTLFCAYRDKANNERDMYLLSQSPGGAGWKRTLASGTPWQINACPMTGNYLTTGTGGPVMAWETKGAISFAHFDARGRKQGAEIVATTSGGKYPVVLVAPDGMTCVSWKRGNELHWRLYAANGDALGKEGSKASPNYARHAGVVTKGGGFVLID